MMGRVSHRPTALLPECHAHSCLHTALHPDVTTGLLLFNQNIIAASPLATAAWRAAAHLPLATNSRIQGNWRHSFWSEIYETVRRAGAYCRHDASPRRGRFNVTDKGGLLGSGYFDMSAVYPNLLLCGILVVGLGRGLFGLPLQHHRLEFQALLLNSIWVTFSCSSCLRLSRSDGKHVRSVIASHLRLQVVAGCRMAVSFRATATTSHLAAAPRSSTGPRRGAREHRTGFAWAANSCKCQRRSNAGDASSCR